jgi:hypothetical protein
MMKIRTTLLVFLLLATYPQREKCKCLPPSPDQKTSWGQQNVVVKEDRILKSLRGKVVIATNQQPLAGVLVEVYDRPEGLLMDWKEREARKTQQHRIAACVTGVDGEFCFPKVPAGKYELRCSKPIDWNSTSVYLIVAPGDPHSTKEKVVVPMQVSQ